MNPPDARSCIASALAPPFSPSSLTRALKIAAGLGPLLESGAGFRHGQPLPHTLEDHTLAVLGLFERHFAPRPLPGAARLPAFRLCLALHDIGKPCTFAEGSTANQYLHTQRILRRIAPLLPLDPPEQALLEALLSGDPVGQFLQEITGPDQAAAQLQSAAASASFPLRDFFALETILFQCDTASYTRAAGYPSDWLLPLFATTPSILPALEEPFFDPGLGRLRLAPRHEERFALLVQAVGRSPSP